MIFPGMEITMKGYKVEGCRAAKLIKKRHHDNFFGNIGILKV